MHRVFHAHFMLFFIVLLVLVLVVYMLTRKDPKD
jgi:ABC-type antimicrobial peptide transport system permease subunit